MSTLELRVMNYWLGDLAVESKVQSQVPVVQTCKPCWPDQFEQQWRISIRLNSSEQSQIALIGLIPLLWKLRGYLQELLFGQS